ncbi:MAG: ATP-binding protein [Methylococcales bacterium]
MNAPAGGNRRLVFLTGARGIGKTASLENFLAAVNRGEFGVLRARCLQLGGVAEPFLPLLEALERRCLEPCGKRLIDNLHRIAPT